MPERIYRKPRWAARTIGARLAAWFNPSVSRLSVPGRVTGRWHTVSVVVLDHDGRRFLVAPYGDTDWSRNLRASGHGRLDHNGRVEAFTAVVVPVEARQPIIDAYLRRYRKMPTVAPSFQALPDPAHHPTFQITPTSHGWAPPRGTAPSACRRAGCGKYPRTGRSWPTVAGRTACSPTTRSVLSPAAGTVPPA